jgi:hypothetical protein
VVTVHLIKLCVGIDTVRQLEDFRDRRRAEMRRRGLEPHDIHVTRNTPRRADEVLDGGSLYWVIRRQIRVRQRIIGIEERRDDEGTKRCALIMDTELIRTEPRAFRPFQGWRYFKVEDAPKDLVGGEDESDDMPEEMRRELRSLGLL